MPIRIKGASGADEICCAGDEMARGVGVSAVRGAPSWWRRAWPNQAKTLGDREIDLRPSPNTAALGLDLQVRQRRVRTRFNIMRL